MSSNVTLSARELQTISAALSVAASVYDDDANNAAAAQSAMRAAAGLEPMPCRLAEQFQRQAREARAIADRIDNPAAGDDAPDDACTNPGGHEWNRTAGEADEARLAGDAANDNVRCIHCGADGDA